MEIPETEIIVTKDGTELWRKTVRPGDYVIGREPECDVQVEVERVAPRHAQLTVNFDHALIEDLGSGSGTLVNGKPVTESTRLWPNQKIQIGAATVELHRLKTVPPPDVSLAPSTAAVKRLLPEEFLREKKYDIGGVVAQGGMGAILNAKEASIERVVAMKVMLDGSSPDDLTRFVAEAKVTGQLEHPNIVPVHELGVDENDQVYYTMKFVKGITLRLVLEKMAAGDEAMLKKYPLPVLLTIFQKVCDAIAFAHSKGVIHRDLKPENIMLGDFGEALVMDWGLAKVIGQKQAPAVEEVMRSMVRTLPPEASGATLAGTVMGTPQYMSPEQARGEVEDLDVRSDIYALGAILYHILALRPAVTGKDAWVIVAKVSQGAVEPLTASKNRPIPDSLAAVVRKAMGFERDQRYPHVADLQRDITAYQSGFATRAEQASLMKQILLLIKRHKGIFTTVFAAWAVITALVVWFIISMRASERETRRQAEMAQQNENKAEHNAEIAEQNEKKAEANERKAVEEKEQTRSALAKAQIALAEGAFREEDGVAMRVALNGVPEDLRDTNWKYLLARSDTSLATIKTGQGTGAESWSVAAHPKQPGVFAIALRDGTVALVNATGETLMKFKAGFAVIMNSGFNPKIAFSPDGERIAIGRMDISDESKSDRKIVIHSARDGKKLMEFGDGTTRLLTFDSEGRRLMQITNEPDQLKVWDAFTGQLLWETKPDSSVRAAFDPKGKFVAIHSDRERIRIVDANSGSLIRELPITTDASAFIAIFSDGIKMLTGDSKGSVRASDVRDGKTLFEIRVSDHRLTSLAFTPDGDRFVTLSNESAGKQSVQVWKLSGGKHLQTLMGGSGEAFDFAVHPLSGEVMVAARITKSWSLTNAPVKWISWGGRCQDACFLGDDSLIFAPTSANECGLFDLPSDSEKDVATISKLKTETQWTPTAQTLPAVWKSKRNFTANTSSGDGRFAAFGHAAPNLDTEYQFIRRSGRAAEEVFSGHVRLSLQFLRLNQNGERLAAFREGIILDPSTAKEIARIFPKRPAEAHDAAWIGNSTRIVSLIAANFGRGVPGSVEQIILSDGATGKQLQMKTHPTAMDCLAVSPDGKIIAEAGADKMVRLRDAETLDVKKEFRAHDDGITALAFHPTLPILATGSWDMTVKLWNLETGKQIEELRGASAGAGRLNFSPSGKRLAARIFTGYATVWEPESLNGKPAPPQ